MPRVLALLGMTLTALLLAAPSLEAKHPFHVSFTEADWNPSTSRLEIALQVWPYDLLTAIEQRFEQSIDLETLKSSSAQRSSTRTQEGPSPEEDLLRRYLSEAFQMTTAEGDIAQLHWVGVEVAMAQAWIFFELELPGGLPDTTLSNRVFFEFEPEQANLIHIRHADTAGRKRILVLNQNHANPADRLTRERIESSTVQPQDRDVSRP